MGRYDGRPGQPGRPLNVGTPCCGKDLVSDRPPRCRPLPAALVDADALTRNGLQLLRGALADLDPHGAPLA